MKLSFKCAPTIVAAAALLIVSPLVQAVDVNAAKALARQNDCFGCHSVDNDKEGPAFHKVADKFKGKPEAEALTRLIAHMTTGERSMFPDGHEEQHKIVMTSPPHDVAQIKNLIRWILNQ